VSGVSLLIAASLILAFRGRDDIRRLRKKCSEKTTAIRGVAIRDFAHSYAELCRIDNHILRLLQKLEDGPANPALVVTIHGLGYKLMP
jgi:hypothetical protein